ncbi:hypothetical protein QNI19_23740 [Cytophagaceae bacterium DM2B3-1]|uniref:Lipoprotein n=1 Tax=Xanthocytophaga flava TaxID=3048013 RepID=A0ABT7CQE6_9BACT|nr:hypothetical protein [Xanthocytophaga flavus]MDJ1495968.1 hypothetical protein [Xanthocytophaga flavus]
MQKHSFIYRLFTILLIATFLVSCGKKDEVEPSPEEKEFAEVQTTVDLINQLGGINAMAVNFSQQAGAINGKISKGRMAEIVNARIASIKETQCGNVSSSFGENGEIIMILDFGNGVTCNGVSYKGKIEYIITLDFSGEFFGYGGKVNLIGYEVDGKAFSGEYTFSAILKSYTGTTALYEYTTKLVNGVITDKDGKKIQCNSEYLLSLNVKIAANGQSASSSVSATGAISGTDASGKAFSATVTKPLVSSSSCQYVVSGTYLIKSETHSDATYDFGNGDCDNKATLTVNGTSKTVTIE